MSYSLDLTIWENSIGHPITSAKYDSELLDAITSVREACKAAGKKSAIFCSSGEQAKEFADQGFDMVNTMTDVGAIGKAFGGAVEAASGTQAKKAGTGYAS